MIYASGPAMLIHAVLAPLQQVTPADQEDLLRCFVQTDERRVIQTSYGGGKGIFRQAGLETNIHAASGDGLRAGDQPGGNQVWQDCAGRAACGGWRQQLPTLSRCLCASSSARLCSTYSCDDRSFAA